MDGAMADQIISKVDGQAQDGQSSSAAQASYNPKQVSMSLESGMMMGDPAASDDDSSPTPDRATTVAEARADVAADDAGPLPDSPMPTTTSTAAPESWDHAEKEEQDFAKADATPASAPTSTGSDSGDIIHQFASGFEATENAVTGATTTTSTAAPAADDKFKFSWDSSSSATASSSDSAKADAPVDYVKKYGLGSESAPADSVTVGTSDPTPKKDALAEMEAKLLGKTSPDGMWIQQHAQGFKGKHHANSRLVSIRLHKTVNGQQFF